MALVAPLSPLGQLSSALSLAATGQMPAAEFGSAVLEHLEPVEAFGFLSPGDTEDLRRFAEGVGRAEDGPRKRGGVAQGGRGYA